MSRLCNSKPLRAIAVRSVDCCPAIYAAMARPLSSSVCDSQPADSAPYSIDLASSGLTPTSSEALPFTT